MPEGHTWIWWYENEEVAQEIKLEVRMEKEEDRLTNDKQQQQGHCPLGKHHLCGKINYPFGKISLLKIVCDSQVSATATTDSEEEQTKVWKWEGLLTKLQALKRQKLRPWESNFLVFMEVLWGSGVDSGIAEGIEQLPDQSTEDDESDEEKVWAETTLLLLCNMESPREGERLNP